ncbi:unnamed protein product [Ixodes pacificus]
MKILEPILLQYLDSQLLGATVLAATRLTPIERKDTYIKIHSVLNLLAIDTYCPSAIPKILALTTLHFQGKSYATTSYMANDPSNARGVIHGVSPDITDEEIRQTHGFGTGNSTDGPKPRQDSLHPGHHEGP